MGAALILLSGGKSSRMGQNKALLPVAGKANIERIMLELQPAFSKTIVVTNQPAEYAQLLNDVHIVQDIYPGLGPLAGIHAGLHASAHELNLVVACDMPFVSNKLAQLLLQESDGYDAVVPRIFGRNQPLFAVYARACLPVVQACLEEQMLRVNFCLKRLSVRYVTEESFPKSVDLERHFYNMNHPTEYTQVQRWAAEEEQ